MRVQCSCIRQTDGVPKVPAKVEEGARDLARRDKVMKRMVKDHGLPGLTRARPARTHFPELARMICYQQLAGRAAAAIHGRFEALFDGPATPAAVLALPVDTMRSVGLSAAKTASIRDLAEKVSLGLVELDRVAKLPDDEVVRELVLVRGIGEWTAHMFLMFQCGRLDIWPTGDLGVRAGYGRLYGIDPPPTPKVLEGLGERFRPYRSIVAWYCWEEADVKTPVT
jgi:DNA-3-methyladenine glycosylase II